MSLLKYVSGELKDSKGNTQYWILNPYGNMVALFENPIGFGEHLELSSESQLWQFANLLGLEYFSFDQCSEINVQNEIESNHSYYRY